MHFKEPRSTGRIEEIETLRAVAIVITLIHHIFYYLFVWPDSLRDLTYKYFTFWSGVDVFFAVSGFVISRELLKRHLLEAKGLVALKTVFSFWIRRAFRILPSAWLWIALFILATVFLNESTAFGTLNLSLTDGIAAFFQFANYHQAQCALGKSSCGINGIYWSLSLEEQFYLVLPLLFILGRKYMFPVLGLALAIQFFLPRPEWSLAWAFRTDGFILGVLLAFWSQKKSYQRWQPRIFSRFASLRYVCMTLLLVAIIAIPNPAYKIPWSTGWLALICAVLVWIASYDAGYLIRPGRLRNFLAWLGSRSYAIYLTHMFAFRLSVELFYRDLPKGQLFTSDSALVFLAVGIPLTFIFSEISYRLIEAPLRIFGRRLSDKISVPSKAHSADG
jgi:peptidoglycan/LPS O-acetylase OafA/YrhL